MLNNIQTYNWFISFGYKEEDVKEFMDNYFVEDRDFDDNLQTFNYLYLEGGVNE